MRSNAKILIGVVAALAVVAAVLIIFLPRAPGDSDSSVTGTIVYRERMALPDDSVVNVTIVDTTSGQPLSTQIISNPGQPPIPYEVPYDESQVNESFMYVVDVTIADSEGNPLFVTRQNFPAITQGNPTSDVEVLLEVAGDAPPTASVFITIEEPVQGAILDIGQSVQVSGQGGALPEGNVVVQALSQDGTVLAEQATIIDAPDAGTGGAGPWAVVLDINVDPGTPGQLYAFAPSPADNSIMAEASVPVTFGQEDAQPFQFSYTFDQGPQDWVTGFADLPADYDPDLFALDSGWGTLPGGLAGNAIFLSGRNASDDLFMYLQRQITGLQPETTYQITFDIELASNTPAGVVGIGGSPGDSVYVKAGAVNREPGLVTDSIGWLRPDIDKGNQASEGSAMINLGTLANPNIDPETATDDAYALMTLNNQNALFQVTSAADGSLWVIIGTDSGFEGATTVYYASIDVTLTEVE